MQRPERTLEEHQQHAVLAQQEIEETMARLHREGIDWRAIFAGVTAAQAQVIFTNVGPREVAPHFIRAAMNWGTEIAKDFPPLPSQD